MICKLLLVNPACAVRHSRKKVLFNAWIKNMALSPRFFSEGRGTSVHRLLRSRMAKRLSNLTILNSYKERTDKFALPTWQTNLLLVSITGKEILVYILRVYFLPLPCQIKTALRALTYGPWEVGSLICWCEWNTADTSHLNHLSRRIKYNVIRCNWYRKRAVPGHRWLINKTEYI